MEKIEKYYNSYWSRRLEGPQEKMPPIRPSIPAFLVKYSQYGSCLNLVPANSKLLDIGCGEGNVTELYGLKKSCQLHGIELSDIAISMAGKRKIAVKKWDLNEFPYPFSDNSFEAITIVDVLEHVIDPLELLKEARRMVTGSGSVIVLVPNFARLSNRLRLLAFGDPLDILHWGGYGDGIEHLHWFSQPKLKSFLLKAGFRKANFYPIGLPFDFIYGLLRSYNLAKMLLVEAIK